MAPFQLSILTSIHNGLAINQLFWDTLFRNTLCPFELIVVDNHSTDGSEIFFEKIGQKYGEGEKRVVYKRNSFNQPYPQSQNQAMGYARHDVLCFLNNDVWVPKGWHLPFEKALNENPHLLLSPSGIEAQPTQRASDILKRRWKQLEIASYFWKTCLLRNELSRLNRVLQWMYGDLDEFESPTRWEEPGYIHGINGNSIVFHRKLLDRVAGIWDERVEAADWHLYLTIASIHGRDPDFPLPRILLNAYIHHFGRYTARRRKEGFSAFPSSVEEVWGEDLIRQLWWGYHIPNG